MKGEEAGGENSALESTENPVLSDEKSEKGKGRPKVAEKPKRGEKTKPEKSKGSKKSKKAD